jgi:UDP-N-acetylmuramyl pentapeptide phosphotransferase/UDP-N-acetylglucosamine-1-phosphate transferase
MISIQNFLLSLIFSTFLSFFLYYFFNKKNFLLDQISSSKHKQLTSKDSSNKVILCGGIIVFINSLFFFDNQLYIIKIFSFFILIIGILSDINKFNSPKFRIISQFFIVLFFLLLNKNLIISDLRIDFLNSYLEIELISIFFTIFCMLILINGSNFLDGLNTLVIGYYFLALTTIVIVSIQFNLNINPNVCYLIIFLSIILLLNFFNKIYLGDAGSYLISFLTAYFLLDFVSNNDSISPYFICLLLWYPAFENLFSILRRFSLKKKVDQADQGHLHQMIYTKFKAISFINKKYLNTFTGMLINFFNFIVFLLSYKYYSLTQNLIIIIILNILVYLFLYFSLKKSKLV